MQAVIATHAPILMCYPGATVLSFDGERLAEIAAAETEHVKITRAFLANPERWLNELLDDTT